MVTIYGIKELMRIKKEYYAIFLLLPKTPNLYRITKSLKIGLGSSTLCYFKLLQKPLNLEVHELCIFVKQVFAPLDAQIAEPGGTIEPSAPGSCRTGATEPLAVVPAPYSPLLVSLPPVTQFAL